MDHRGVHVCGITKHRGTRVTIDHDTFEECIQMIRMLKIQLATMKEAQQQGYVVETLDISGDEVNDRED